MSQTSLAAADPNDCYRLFRPTQFRITMVITLHTHRVHGPCRYFEPMKYLEAIRWNLLARLDASPFPWAKTFQFLWDITRFRSEWTKKGPYGPSPPGQQLQRRHVVQNIN